MKLAVNRARASGTPAVFWLDKNRAHDAQTHRQGGNLSQGPRHHRPRHPHPAARRSLHVLARAHRQGARHHLRHRQRPARLPHRPLPDPRSRHLRQDALHRPAHERRRPLRNRSRRLRAEARPAVRRRKTTCAGIRSASSSPSRRPSSTSPKPSACRKPRSSPTRSTPPPASSSKTTARPAASSAPSTTAAPTSTSPSTGPRPSPRRTTTPNSKPSSPPSPKHSSPTRTSIVAELLAVQGKPVDIGGYYLPDEAKADAALRPSGTFNAHPGRALSRGPWTASS